MNNKIATVKDWIDLLQQLPQDATLGVSFYTPNGLCEYEMYYVLKDNMSKLIKSVKNWDLKDCYFDTYYNGKNEKEIVNNYYIEIN